MLADLDLLLIAVYCTADDLLPKKAANARRIVTDAEVVTLCVAQLMMGIPSDARFIAVARSDGEIVVGGDARGVGWLDMTHYCYA